MATAPAPATQSFVPVKEIRDGIIVLKDGGYRGVLICSSVNFALKDASEQRAIIGGFQTFLNTLDFSIQIVINSRKMDLRPYLALIADKEKDQTSELMRLQLREYLEFIRTFADQQNIMTKTFYIVVPFTPRGGGAQIAAATRFFGGGKGKSAAETATTSFNEDRVQLEQRMTLIAQSLSGTGVRAVALGTEEVIELLYRAFNPGELENPIRLDA